MTKIEVNGHWYAIGKMGALTQFHVSRRIAPILAQLGISIHTLQTGMDKDLTDFVPVLGPVTEMLSKMSDDDANYILFTCLGVVTRQQGEKFASVSAGTNLMFDDIDMPTMLRLVVEVVRDNLGGFMSGLFDATPSSSA